MFKRERAEEDGDDGVECGDFVDLILELLFKR